MYNVCRVKLRPKKKQRDYFDQNTGCCRFVYNNTLQYCIEHYERNKDLPKEDREKRPSGFDLQKRLPALKKEFPFLAEVDSQALKFAATQVDVAFKNFFRRLKVGGAPGFPRFKAKFKSRPSFTLTQGQQIKWTDRSLILPKIGKVALDRSNWNPPDLDVCPSRLKRVTITLSPCGSYYASVLFQDELPDHIPLPLAEMAPLIDKMTVLDLGLNVLFRYESADGDWDDVETPRFLRSRLSALRKVQKRLSRKTAKSRRWEKQRLKVAKLHAKIKQKRHQFFIDTANYLVENSACLVVEDLKIKDMIQKNAEFVGRKRKLFNRAFADQALGEFVRILEHKCLTHKVPLLKIDPLLSPNKICSVCGMENEEVTLATVYWSCKNCNVEHHRSTNCLKILRRFAVEQIEQARPGKL